MTSVIGNKECYHCKATADLVWSEGYGGIHTCGFCKVLEDKSCGECERQNDGTFKTGEDGFLRCPDCDDTPMKCRQCDEEFDRDEMNVKEEICLPCWFNCKVCEDRREEHDECDGLCDACFESHAKCSKCEDYGEQSDMREYESGKWLCDCCDTTHTKCSECEEFHEDEFIRYRDKSWTPYCVVCFKNVLITSIKAKLETATQEQLDAALALVKAHPVVSEYIDDINL